MPRSKIAPEDLIPYASAMCTQGEAASMLGVHRRTIENLLKKPSYRRVWEECRNNTRLQIRQAQIKAAVEKGDRTALIWLGKQYLDQRDSPREVDINTNVKVEFVATWGGGELPAAEDEMAIEGEVEEDDDDEE